MRNLTYPETATAFLLISVATIGAYQSWFEPVLAQTERDRQETQRILYDLARRQERASVPAALAADPAPAQLSPLSAPPGAKPSGLKVRRHDRPVRRPESAGLDVGCEGHSDDPLCGALDR